ncbi:MAG: hypothetical protein AAGC63_10770, partial [Propionicimonas sp.]
MEAEDGMDAHQHADHETVGPGPRQRQRGSTGTGVQPPASRGGHGTATRAAADHVHDHSVDSHDHGGHAGPAADPGHDA